MATFQISGGELEGRVISGGIDNTLPTPPAYVDNTLPSPPPGVWPPPSRPITPLPPGFPGTPGAVWPPLWSPDPGYDQGHPRPPHVSNRPPGSLPPYASGQPVPPPPGGEVDNTLPSEGEVDNALPSGGGGGRPDNALPSQKHLVAIVDISASGSYRVIGYTVVDPSLDFWGGGSQPAIDNSLPGGRPPRPDNTLPPTAQPKG